MNWAKLQRRGSEVPEQGHVPAGQDSSFRSLDWNSKNKSNDTPSYPLLSLLSFTFELNDHRNGQTCRTSHVTKRDFA
jgi:hypothetical protein